MQLSSVTWEPADCNTDSRVLSRFGDMYTTLYLTWLEELKMTFPRSRQFQWPSESHRACLAYLSSLRLPYCNATENVLDQLLSVKPPLKELLYDYFCAENLSINTDYFFDMENLSYALSYVQTTLESLTLSIELQPQAYNFFHSDRDCLKASPGSFHRYPRLTSIEVPFVMLNG